MGDSDVPQTSISICGRNKGNDEQAAAGDIDVNIPQDWLGQDDPIIVEARPVGLPENAVPMDRVAILPGDTDVPLLLRPGSYTIEAYTESQSLGEIARVVK